jgi:pimeloyl-ACP methyl ester carboxylesterase
MKHVWKILGAILLFAILILLIVPLIYPVPPLKDTVPEKDLAEPDSRFVDINGVTVHYKEMGQGEPVFILLHGFGASTYSWQEVIEPLSKSGRVIAYDRPGFGLTSRPMPGDWTGTNPYGVQGNVEMLDNLMNQLGVEKAVLVGNSAGGSVAAAFAIEHPDRVQGLVLVDPAIGNGNRERIPSWLSPLMATPQMRHIGQLLVRSIAGKTGDETIRLAWHDPSLIDQQVYDGYRKPLKANNWDKALYEFTIAQKSDDLQSRLGELKVPILVMTGDDDRIIPTANTIQLANKIPGADLEVFNQCGHVPQEECPEQFMSGIKTFLKGILQ